MSKISIELNGLEDAQKTLSTIRGGLQKAVVRAINRTVQGIQTDAVREVAKEFNLSQKEIKRDFVIKKANFADLSAYVKAKGKPVPLGKFLGTRQVRKGISVRVKKDRGRKVIPHAFMATMKSGHTGAFWRVGKDRLPIKELFSSRIPDILGNDEVMTPIMQKASDRLSKNIGHEFEFLIRGQDISGTEAGADIEVGIDNA